MCAVLPAGKDRPPSPPCGWRSEKLHRRDGACAAGRCAGQSPTGARGKTTATPRVPPPWEFYFPRNREAIPPVNLPACLHQRAAGDVPGVPGGTPADSPAARLPCPSPPRIHGEMVEKAPDIGGVCLLDRTSFQPYGEASRPPAVRLFGTPL